MTGETLSTWLISGASSGIGKSLALVALNTGLKVIGTTRDVSKAEQSFPEFSPNGGIWKQLDPAHRDSFEDFSKCCREYDVDVLVNNAASTPVIQEYMNVDHLEPGRGDISSPPSILWDEPKSRLQYVAIFTMLPPFLGKPP